MSENKHTIDISHKCMDYPKSPKTLQVRVYAERSGIYAACAPRAAYDMPAELLGMDETEFLEHPWTQFLIAEADEKLELAIEKKRKELAA